LSHDILGLELPDHIITILKEWLLPVLVINEYNNLYKWTPTYCQHGVWPLHLVWCHTMPPRECYMTNWVLFWQRSRGMQGIEDLEIRGLSLTNQYSVRATNSCD
jgi:hypothetical protein